MNISVCVASRGPAIGLWFTFAACEAVKGNHTLDYNAVVSGRERGEREQLLEDWGNRIEVISEPLIPPVARNRAASKATGDILVFFDDHCIPTSGFFDRIEADFYDPNISILHGSYITGPGSPYHYFHFYGIKSMVQGDYRREPIRQFSPYRCASAPHGFFAIRREVWQALGGYPDWYEAFGGEEASFDLRAWASGYEVWIDPQLVFYHYSARESERGYPKQINTANYERCLRELHHDLPRLRDKFESEGIPF